MTVEFCAKSPARQWSADYDLVLAIREDARGHRYSHIFPVYILDTAAGALSCCAHESGDTRNNDKIQVHGFTERMGHDLGHGVWTKPRSKQS